MIPSLAIHMDRTTNEGKKLTAQTDLMPLLGKGNVDILELVAKELGVDRKQILAQDLFVYNREAGTKLGPDGELILCPRLDDLQCVYGLLEGFLRQKNPLETPVLCLFDNEEIGSSTAQGAMSTLAARCTPADLPGAGLGRDRLSSAAGGQHDGVGGQCPRRPSQPSGKGGADQSAQAG